MAEYIEREALYEKAYWHGEHPDVGNPFPDGVDAIDIKDVDAIPAADVAPVRHGRWIKHEETLEDAYWHHKCSECNVNAPFDYKMREDWDEGMDGEWYSLGLVDDGINEHLTDYCPNCGCRMDLEG